MEQEFAIVIAIAVYLFMIMFGFAEIIMKLNDVRLDIIDCINRKVKNMECVVCGNQLCKYQNEGKCSRMAVTLDNDGQCVRFAPKPEFEHFFVNQKQIVQDPVQKITKVGEVEDFIEKMKLIKRVNNKWTEFNNGNLLF